jgi:uncharacterized membrane protein
MLRTLRTKFGLFVAILIGGAALATLAAMRLGHEPFPDAGFKGFMIGFDLAAAFFLLASAPLLRIDDPQVIRDHAASNDANRPLLLLITVAISAAILGAVAMETIGGGGVPGGKTKMLIIATLGVAWLFGNSIYALHYAHLYYTEPDGGLDFKQKALPGYADFVYFAFTLGMTFQTSDVDIADKHIRNVVTLHCLAAFVFNLGILAFTINVLGG